MLCEYCKSAMSDDETYAMKQRERATPYQRRSSGIHAKRRFVLPRHCK